MCSRSGLKIGCPFRNLRRIEIPVSTIGRPKQIIGIDTATTVEDFSCDPAKARTLSRQPTNRLPESPRKIVAGLKLKRRKPRTAPAIMTERYETRALWLTRETTKTVIVENSAEPAAKPSKPSIKLKALVMRMTHKIVRP